MKYSFCLKFHTRLEFVMEDLGYIKCYSSSSPRPIKNAGTSIRNNFQKICSWQRSEAILELRKKVTFLEMINKSIIYNFYNTSLTASPTVLNTRTTAEIFQQPGKQDSFRHILKSSASMFESLGSEFFRIVNGIKSGPQTFDKSRFAMF